MANLMRNNNEAVLASVVVPHQVGHVHILHYSHLVITPAPCPQVAALLDKTFHLFAFCKPLVCASLLLSFHSFKPPPSSLSRHAPFSPPVYTKIFSITSTSRTNPLH